ncbi:MAG: cation-translocating P-type ATPase, partial [Clostridia bacterium]
SENHNAKVAGADCCSEKHNEKVVDTDCHCDDNNKHSCCTTHNHDDKCSCDTKESTKSSASNATHSCCTDKNNSTDSCGCGSSKGGDCCGKNDKSISIKTQIVLLIISFISLVISFINPAKIFNLDILMYFDVAWVSVILCGYPIFVSAFKNLFVNKKITSSLLISVAITASIALEAFTLFNMAKGMSHGESYIFAAGEIAFLMAIGGLIEDYTVRKSRAGIEKLINLAPVVANVLRDGEFVLVNVSDVKIGDIVLVKPDDVISVDGEIIKGQTAVDQSNMTGEAIPVDKTVGDGVFAGTYNKNGVIEIRVTTLSNDMAITKLINLTTEAEGKKAPISRIADKFASLIVPLAISLSVIVAIVAYMFLNVDLITAIIRGVTILVVFCPCSLALATPTAIAAGLGNASFKGVLIKSGQALEIMSKVNTVAFDKTGTLTTGEILVTDVITNNITRDELLKLTASAEMYSTHPIAKAILSCANSETLITPTNTNSLTGVGISATVGNDEILVAQLSYLEKGTYDKALLQKADVLLDSGKTVIVVLQNKEIIGFIALSDMIRDNSSSTVMALSSMNINSVMLTGDNESTANSIAKKSGIKTVYHSLLPEGKVSAIEAIRKTNTVCMVGDGVNDAPALVTADTSIAMGALGSDIAIESADIALMSSDISKIPYIINLSKRVMNTIRGNIGLSMTINVIAVIVSTLGLLTPVTGALVHNLSSIIVVCNSALILTKKK